MKKLKKIMLTVSMILLVMSVSVYSATIYDMQKVNMNVEKPIAKFSVEYETLDGKEGEVTSNSKYYDSDVYSFDQTPTSVKVPVGTKIYFEDLSSPGSGSKLTAYDFQVYTPSASKLYYLKSLDEAPSMTLDEEGKYEFYLCVMDNYQRVNGYDNWSVNGNHRWLTKRQDNSLDKFWWYFAQVNIYVYGTDQEADEPIDEPIIEDPEIEEPEIINHNPELHVIKPDKFYPKEITDKMVKTNTVKWVYYDEDGDDFGHGAYELYKKENGNRKLIDSKTYISDEDDLHVNIEGNMGDKFTLDMYVYDSEGNKAMKGIDITIITLTPNIKIINKDRTYIEDDLDIEIKRVDEELAEYIDINYINYEITDEDKNVIKKDNGMLPSKLILKEKYKEDKSYEIHQTIKLPDGMLKTFISRFYIVPILEPQVSLDMINGYIGEIKDTGLIIVQKQSPLRGNLPEYIYNFTNDDGYYEIYYGSNLKWREKGLCYKLELDDRFEQGKTYKLIQYVKNGAGREGKGTTNIQIKEVKEDKLSLKIIERDNNPLTPFDEIYPKEKIYLKANLEAFNKVIRKESWIENSNGEAIYHISGLFDGLVQIDEIGKYIAYSKVYFENDKELIASVPFTVKKVEKPIISHDIIKDTYFRNEIFAPNMRAKDINLSEEHPNGYKIKTNYVWSEMKNEGAFISTNLKGYENKRYYSLIQNAINSEFENISSKEELKIYLDNKSPFIETLDYYECSIGENVEIKAKAFDEDGWIETFDSDLACSISSLNSNTKEMTINYLSNEVGTFKYKIWCIDDSGDKCEKNIFIKVYDNKEYPYIKLFTIEDDRLKENRYIQIEFGNEFNLTNHLCINDFKTEDEINNDDFHIVFESISSRKNVIGIYFKHVGEFKISNSIFVNSNEIKRELVLNIKKDEAPIIKIDGEKELYRSPETKSASMNLITDIFSDDQIEKVELYIDGVCQGTFNQNEQININFGINVMGTKKVQTKVYETHNYMPPKGHKLYEELNLLKKNNTSNEIVINILNMKPEINFNINNNKQIRIIK